MHIFLFPVKMLSNGWPISCLCKHDVTCCIIRLKKPQHVHALGEWEGSCPQIMPVTTGNLGIRDHGSDRGGGPKVRSRVWGNCLLAWLLCTLDSQIHFPSTYDQRAAGRLSCQDREFGENATPLGCREVRAGWSAVRGAGENILGGGRIPL